MHFNSIKVAKVAQTSGILKLEVPNQCYSINLLDSFFCSQLSQRLLLPQALQDQLMLESRLCEKRIQVIFYPASIEVIYQAVS